MKRCPACHRFGIEYDKCLWKDCLWENKDDIDLDKVYHPITHWKFINAITEKISFDG